MRRSEMSGRVLRDGARGGWQEQLIAVPSIQTVASCNTRGIEDVTAETP